MNLKSVDKDIIKFNIYMFLKQTLFIFPIIVLFYQSNGLSMTQVMIIQSFFALSTFLLEIPTGALGDLLGYKFTLVLGTFSFSVGMVIYALSSTFIMFLFSELFCAISVALISGSDVAFIHQILENKNKTHLFKRILANSKFYMFLGATIAFLLGGYIADHLSYRINFLFTAITYITITLIFITYPNIKQKEENSKNYINIIKDSVMIVKSNKQLLWLFIFYSIINSFSLAFFWMYQPYMKQIGVPIYVFGYVYAVVNILAAISMKFAYKLERYGFIKEIVILSLLVIIPAILIGLINSIYMIFFLIFFRIYYGLSKVLFSDIILQKSENKNKATVLSIFSLGHKISYFFILPIAGRMIDFTSTIDTYLYLGLLLLTFVTIMILINQRKLNNRIYKLDNN